VVDGKKKWHKGAAAGKTHIARHYLAARRGSRRNGNNDNCPPLDVICSVCGMKMMQAMTMFEDQEASSVVQMKAMCYKKDGVYCGDYITGINGTVPWDHMTRDCEAPEDPWTRPLPPGTWCSTTCKTTMTAMASSWGCCAMNLAIASDV